MTEIFPRLHSTWNHRADRHSSVAGLAAVFADFGTLKIQYDQINSD